MTLCQKLIDGLVNEDGVSIDDELLVNDLSLRTAYYNPSSGAHVYLQMPEVGSPSTTSSDARWGAWVDMPGDGIKGRVIVERIQLSIDEMNYQVTFTKRKLVYVKDRLIRPTLEPPELDTNDPESNLAAFLEQIAANEELMRQVYAGSYDEEMHGQIVGILDSLTPDHELAGYNPADGEY